MSPEGTLGGVSQAGGGLRGPQQPASVRRDPAGQDFAAALARETAGMSLKFSAHAVARLAARKIDFTPEELARVAEAAGLAARRGSRDALLMLDDLGLVVNIQNRTVLTALDLRTMNDGIVTNIDSTVLVRKG